MSWQDRAYNRDSSSPFEGGGRSLGLPRPTPYVTWLLIANIGIFFFQILDQKQVIFSYGALYGNEGWATFFEPWRLITYQFLHADPGHLLMNMLGLYFFGPPLERYWGSKRFLFFYLFCGIVAGLAFVLFSSLFAAANPIIGASGAVLGLLAACALLFPQMVLILVLFPVQIRAAALLIAGVSVLYILWNRNLSEACHLGGMAAGVLYLKAGPVWRNFIAQRSAERYRTLMDQEAEDRQVVDQILDKVHQNGLQSLTRREKQTLRDITQRQKSRDDLRKKGRA
jgi:membrane associated rhomboid family serine protease